MPSTRPKLLPVTMFAVLRATPGRVISSSIVPGTFPSYASTILVHAPRIARAFWLKNPVERMSSFSSSSGTAR
jgi:hypothetical protein